MFCCVICAGPRRLETGAVSNNNKKGKWSQPNMYLRNSVYCNCSFMFFVLCVQYAQAVLIALFNLNPPEFSLMLAALPKAFQVCWLKVCPFGLDFYCVFLIFIIFNYRLGKDVLNRRKKCEILMNILWENIHL